MPSPSESSPLSLHDALPILACTARGAIHQRTRFARQAAIPGAHRQRGGRRRSEEHTSELQSLRHIVCRLPARAPLFPCTTLFRSWPVRRVARSTSALGSPGRRQFLERTASVVVAADRKSTRLNSSHLGISYAVSQRELPSFPARRSSDLGLYGAWRDPPAHSVRPAGGNSWSAPPAWWSPRHSWPAHMVCFTAGSISRSPGSASGWHGFPKRSRGFASRSFPTFTSGRS